MNVKKLDWVSLSINGYRASSIIGPYEVWPHGKQWVATNLAGGSSMFETDDKAKAAAQADYETRILSALTNTSGDDEAPVVASGVTPGQYEFAAERLTLSIEGELDGLCIEMDVARRIVDFVLTETFGRAPA